MKMFPLVSAHVAALSGSSVRHCLSPSSLRRLIRLIVKDIYTFLETLRVHAENPAESRNTVYDCRSHTHMYGHKDTHPVTLTLQLFLV